MRGLRAFWTPLALLACFLAAALAFFLLAAGGDAARLDGWAGLAVFEGNGEKGEVRRDVSRQLRRTDEPPIRMPGEDAAGIAAPRAGNGLRPHEFRPGAERSADPTGGVRIVARRFGTARDAFVAEFRTRGVLGGWRMAFRRNPARWALDLDGAAAGTRLEASNLPGRIARVRTERRGKSLRLIFLCAERPAGPVRPATLQKTPGGFRVVIPGPGGTANRPGEGEQTTR